MEKTIKRTNGAEAGAQKEFWGSWDRGVRDVKVRVKQDGGS